MCGSNGLTLVVNEIWIRSLPWPSVGAEDPIIRGLSSKHQPRRMEELFKYENANNCRQSAGELNLLQGQFVVIPLDHSSPAGVVKILFKKPDPQYVYIVY